MYIAFVVAMYVMNAGVQNYHVVLLWFRCTLLRNRDSLREKVSLALNIESY